MRLLQAEELCLLQLLRSAGAVLLQREIPEEVNVHVAGIAAAAGVPVLLDCGGVEGPISSELLKNISILSPNETELARLTGSAVAPLACSGYSPHVAPSSVPPGFISHTSTGAQNEVM